MNKPLKLNWFGGQKNFGDAISPEIVSYVSRRPVVFARAPRMQLVAVGSILGVIGNVPPDISGDRLPYVWGTGSHHDVLPAPVKSALSRVRIAAVRGPLTAALVGCGDIPLGDPGLLAAEMVGPQRRSGKIGVVLHYAHQVPVGLVWRLLRDDRVCMIDVTDPDHLSVVRRIGSCRHVISSSLHGLVVADAFGIPNTWMQCPDLFGTPNFKFRDYAGAIGRNFEAPIALSELLQTIDALPAEQDLPKYFDNIAAVRKDLREAFPAALRSAA